MATPAREREGDARDAEEDEPADDGVLRPESRRRQPARDPAEERAGAECGEQEPRARLREVELVRVARDERRQRRVQQHVDEDDRADESDQPPHASQDMRGRARRTSRPKKCTEPVAPSSGNPTDLRRSECHSENHQPRTLRTRCSDDTKRPAQAGQAPFQRNFAHFAATSSSRRLTRSVPRANALGMPRQPGDFTPRSIPRDCPRHPIEGAVCSSQRAGSPLGDSAHCAQRNAPSR